MATSVHFVLPATNAHIEAVLARKVAHLTISAKRGQARLPRSLANRFAFSARYFDTGLRLKPWSLADGSQRGPAKTTAARHQANERLNHVQAFTTPLVHFHPVRHALLVICTAAYLSSPVCLHATCEHAHGSSSE